MASSDTTRKLIGGTFATTSVLVAIGVAIAANLVASQLFWRVDMTENQIYTLSEASEKAVANLEAPIDVKVFISPDMPPPLHKLDQLVQDTLTEYQSASKNKLSFEIISPEDDEEIEETAKGYGCEKVGIGQQSEDEVSLRAVYKCVAFIQGDQQQVIQDLRVSGNPEADNLEYDFTKAILNLTTTESRKIGFVSGFGGIASNPQFVQGVGQVFTQLYGNLIEPVDVNLAGETPAIPEDVQALVLLNPTETVSEQARFAIDQFIQRGGSVGWYQSSSKVDEKLRQQMLQQMGNNPNARLPELRQTTNIGLAELFSSYGITHSKDLLLDWEHALAIGFTLTDKGLQQVSNPASFQIIQIDRSLPFLSQLPPLAVPGTGSLVISEDIKENPDVQVIEALKTESSAVSRKPVPPTFDFQSLSEKKDTDTPGPFVVAAALQGVLPSHYQDNPLPEGKTEADLIDPANKKPARVFVMASGEFYQPNPKLGFDQRLAGLGQQLLFGSFEWLAQDSSLSNIRNKSMPRFIGDVKREDQRSLQFVNILMVPAIFALIGLIMFQRRKRRRSTLTL